MPAKDPQMYAVYFEGSDGTHLSQLTYTHRDTAAAMRHAKAIFRNLTVKEVKPVSGPEEIEQLKRDLLAQYPSRVPIDEKTAGEPNRVVDDPTLLSEEDQ